MKIFSSSFFSVALVVVLFLPLRVGAQGTVSQLLGQRHFSATTAAVAELEQLAGGRAPLVEELLRLRRLESPPFVGINAEKVLLRLADGSDASNQQVLSALEQDISSQTIGLARVIVMHLEQVPSAEARQRLARKALALGESDQKFARLTRKLLPQP